MDKHFVSASNIKKYKIYRNGDGVVRECLCAMCEMYYPEEVITEWGGSVVCCYCQGRAVAEWTKDNHLCLICEMDYPEEVMIDYDRIWVCCYCKEKTMEEEVQKRISDFRDFLMDVDFWVRHPKFRFRKITSHQSGYGSIGV